MLGQLTHPSGVTLENWQVAPQLHWSFQHIEDLFPTAIISRGTGPVARLPPGFSAVGDLAVPQPDGSILTVARDHGRDQHRRVDGLPPRPRDRRALPPWDGLRHAAPAHVGQQVAGRRRGRRAGRGRCPRPPAAAHGVRSRAGGPAATPVPSYATCSTCARASTSPRTTSIRRPRYASWSRRSAGRRASIRWIPQHHVRLSS